MIKPEIGLSEQEQIILRDVLEAASESTESYHTEINTDKSIGVKEVRLVKPFFDLFQLVNMEKADSIFRLTGEDGNSVIRSYHLPDCGKSYTKEDVYLLKCRLQAFLKEVAAENRIRPRILYIADCHFYHDRVCREMDKRRFSGFEEMNAHMIDQWNRKVTDRDH